MADPVQLLRQYNIDKKNFIIKDGLVTFDNISFRGSDDTNFRKSTRTEKDDDEDGLDGEKDKKEPEFAKSIESPFYPISSLAFFMRHKIGKYIEYLRAANTEGFYPVSRVDRKVVLDYLNGSIQDCENIDKFVPLATPVSRPSSGHAPSSVSSLLSSIAPTDIRNVAHLSSANHASSATSFKKSLPAGSHALPSSSGSNTTSAALRLDNKSAERTSGANAAGGISQAISTSRLAELKAKLQKRKLETTKTGDDAGGVVLTSAVKREDLSAPDREQRELSRLISRLGRQYTDRKTVLHIQSSQTNWADVMSPLVLQLRTNLEGGPSAHHHALQQHASANPGGTLALTHNGVAALGPSTANAVDNKAAINLIGQQQAALALSSIAGDGDAAAALKKARTEAMDGAGYSRYDQERFMGVSSQEIGFKFDTMATYSTLNKPKDAAGNMSQGYGTGGTDKRYMVGGRSLSRSPSGGGGGVPKSPIIIIPNISNSIISIQNVREILEELRYVSPENVKRDGHAVENDTIVIHHRDRAGEHSASYKVTNNPARITQDDWPRVVAAFVQGQTWQFKGWPWPSPVEIFNNIRGFHLKWDDMSLDPNIAKWNVQVIELNRSKRHLDKAAILKFWDFVERARQRGNGVAGR